MSTTNLSNVTPSRAKALLSVAVKHGYTVCLAGPPGAAKTAVCIQAAQAAGMDHVVMHPNLDDPTTYSGQPVSYKSESGVIKADFIPYNKLAQLVRTETPLVCIIDDIGQATPAVQNAVGNLIYTRTVGRSIISDKVRFLLTTNRRQDGSGVGAFMEQLKSRCHAILEIEPDADSWVDWALGNDIDFRLIAFIRNFKDFVHKFVPSRDIRNYPCFRTLKYVSDWLKAGVEDLDIIAGAVGDEFALQFTAFLQVFADLPTFDAIVAAPDKAKLPTKPASLYAVIGLMIHNLDDHNFDLCIEYAKRFKDAARSEFLELFLADAVRKVPDVANTRAYVEAKAAIKRV